MVNRFFVASPSSMEGFSCYTDASSAPDQLSTGSTSAGLGIYISNSQLQPPLTVSFKAVLTDFQSVFTAEAAALACHTRFPKQIKCYLYVCQDLVPYI
jgi:hypothetical protein